MKFTKKVTISMLVVLMAVMLYCPVQSFAVADEMVIINKANFPDAVFRSYVKKSFDADGNGILSASEINNITEIRVRGSNYRSLKGIEQFPELKKLDCSGCGLSSLDVSKNTKLMYLDCSGNYLSCLDINNTNIRYLKTVYYTEDEEKAYAQKLLAYGNGIYCKTNASHQFDLSGLEGFNVSKTSNWSGGYVRGHILTFTQNNVSYTYNCGHSYKIDFRLKEAKKVKITFKGNGGKLSVASKQYYEHFNYDTLPKPTRKGYMFKGWYTKKTGGSRITGSDMVTGAITLYAHWIKK